MIDKTNFMETLRLVVELTKTSNEPLSKEEVMSYFNDIELTKEQQDLVYQYVLKPKDEIELEEETEGVDLDNASIQEEESGELGESEEPEEKSVFFDMYQEDIKSLPVVSKEEERELYAKLAGGDHSVIAKLSDIWLPRVVEIMDNYDKHQVNKEDLLQEGNLGLLSVLSRLVGDLEVIKVEQYIEESIMKAMEDYIDESMDDKDWESTVVAKATLIHEALEVLAKDLGRVPTTQELSTYTRISIEEIEDIMKLSNPPESGNK